jgi:hypothetical protein
MTETFNINEWRSEIEECVASDVGYASALLVDAQTQRDTEKEWLQDDSFSHFRVPVRSNDLSLEAAKAAVFSFHVRKEPKLFDGEAVLASLIAEGALMGGAPHLFSLAAGLNFRKLLASAQIAKIHEAYKLISEFSLIVSPSNDTAVDDLLHETTIRTFSLNSLRSHIPNFGYCYGMVKIQETQVGEIIESFPTGALTMKEALRTMTSPEVLKLFAQISLALKFANANCGFTHYNLSPDNIMLAKPAGWKEPFYIPYGDNILVASDWIAFFTSFGTSHISSKNSEKRSVIFGNASRGREISLSQGIFRDRPNPITDIYRLIITTAALSRTYENLPVSDTMDSLMTFFNPKETVLEILKHQQKSNYNLPLSRNFDFNFDDFLTHLKRTSKNFGNKSLIVTSLPSPTSKIFAAGANFYGDGGTIDKVSYGGGWWMVVPESFPCFFDIYSKLLHLETESSINAARAFAASFIKGFSSENSALNKACVHLRKNVEEYLCILNTASSLPSPISNATLAAAMGAYLSMVDTYRIFKYSTTGLYWKTEETVVPDCVENLELFVKKTLFSVRKEIAVATATANRRTLEMSTLAFKCKGDGQRMPSSSPTSGNRNYKN